MIIDKLAPAEPTGSYYEAGKNQMGINRHVPRFSFFPGIARLLFIFRPLQRDIRKATCNISCNKGIEKGNEYPVSSLSQRLFVWKRIQSSPRSGTCHMDLAGD